MILPISVFIITKDEEDRVPLAIRSVQGWVDEVIVVDSGSKDKTTQIATELGAKVFFNDWKGYGPQKVFSESLCRNSWLLNIDADEEISPALRDEIINEFSGSNKPCKDGKVVAIAPEYKAYRIVIKDISRFSNKAARFASRHIQLRLYHKDYAGFKDSTVHDSVVLKEGVNEKIYTLKHPVMHRTFRSYSHAIEKINRYSSMQAEDMFRRGRKPSAIRLVLEPFIGFFKGYFIKRHCFLGVEGFVEGVIYAFARTIRIAKAREMWAIKDLNKGGERDEIKTS
jgi:glycosyltransferase involved in cell wall biosynthesis